MTVEERTAIEPGSPAELEAFANLQARLAPMYRRIFSDRQAPRTVVVVPSLSLDLEVQAKITGVTHYEERMLCLLMLLRLLGPIWSTSPASRYTRRSLTTTCTCSPACPPGTPESD